MLGDATKAIAGVLLPRAGTAMKSVDRVGER
jgi:hypothetical protein